MSAAMVRPREGEKNAAARDPGTMAASLQCVAQGAGIIRVHNVAAMKQADSTEPAKYLSALKSIQYPGVTGQMAFDKEGNLSDPSFTIYRVQQGKWVPVDTLGGTVAAK